MECGTPLTPDQERGLLEKYRPRLRRAARNMLNLVDESRFVEDLAQEGWIAMWREIKAGKTREDHLIRAASRRMQTCRTSWIITEKERTQVPGGEELPEFGISYQLDLAYHRVEIMRVLSNAGISSSSGVGNGRRVRTERLTPAEAKYIYLQFFAFTGGRFNPLLKEHFGYAPSAIWKSAREKLAIELDHLRGCYD